MDMQRHEILLAAVLMLASGAAVAQNVPKGEAIHGRKLFAAYGCALCHGYQGQGSNAGLKLAPNPAPYAAFAYQVRQPRARMPAYVQKNVSDQDLADIYAYLLTIPKARTVAETPMLAAPP